MATPAEVDSDHQLPEIDPIVLPYVLPEQDPLASIPEAADAFWQQYGNKDAGITSYESYLAAKKAFESQEGNIEVAILGGGYGGIQTASRIRASFPQAHVVIFEQSDRIGGMGVDAISPFVGSHAKAKGNTQREAMKLATDPGVDIITKHKVEDQDIPELKQRFGFKVIVDARGSEPNKLPLPYGQRVMDIFQYLGKVNTPFDTDGHFGRVHLPFVTDAKGVIKPGYIVGGGNAGRDLQVANELVATVDAIEKIHGVPRDRIAVEAIAAKGSRIVRESLGIKYPANGVTRVLYRGDLGKMKVSKLLRGAAKLDEAEMAKRIREEALLWQQTDGGLYVGNTQIVDVKDDPEGGLFVTLENTKLHSTDVYPASFIAAATGFQRRTPVPGTVLVGIPVEGRGDLASTAVTVRGGTLDGVKVAGAMPEVLGRLQASEPSSREAYDTFLRRIAALQVETGQRFTTGEPGDPVRHAMDHAPAYIIQKAFLTPKKVEPVAIPPEPIVAPIVEIMPSRIENPLLESNLHTIVALLPFVEAGLHHKGDVEIVPFYDAATGKILQGFEFKMRTAGGDGSKDSVGLGIRVVERGLERQVFDEWFLEENGKSIAIRVSQRSGVDVVLDESFDGSIQKLHKDIPQTYGPDFLSVPFEHRDIATVSDLHSSVEERKIARLKALVLSQLRDPLLARVHTGGHIPSEELDMINMLLNITEEHITVHNYFARDSRTVFNDFGESESSYHLTLHLVDKQRRYDEERDLNIRMLSNGEIQIGKGNRWVTLEDMNDLRSSLGEKLGITIPGHVFIGREAMNEFRTIVRAEQGALGMFYVNGHIDGFKDRGAIAQEQRESVLNKLMVSPEGHIYVRQSDGKQSRAVFKKIESDRQMRKLLKTLLVQEGVEIVRKERAYLYQEKRTDALLYTAAAIGGIAVSAGMNYLVKAPQILGIVSLMLAPSMASAANSLAQEQEPLTQGTPEYTAKRRWRRLTGAAFWFLAGVMGESGLEMATGVNPISSVAGHTQAPGVEVAANATEAHHSADVQTATSHPTATHTPTPEFTQTLDVSTQPQTEIPSHGDIYVSPEVVTETPPQPFDFSTISDVPFTEEAVKDYARKALGGGDGWVSPEGRSQWEVIWSNYLMYGNDVDSSEAAKIIEAMAQTTSYADYMAHHTEIFRNVAHAIATP